MVPNLNRIVSILFSNSNCCTAEIKQNIFEKCMLYIHNFKYNCVALSKAHYVVQLKAEVAHFFIFRLLNHCKTTVTLCLNPELNRSFFTTNTILKVIVLKPPQRF